MIIRGGGIFKVQNDLRYQRLALSPFFLKMKIMKCDSLTCPICRWGECVGDLNIAKELGWCEKTDDEIIEMEQEEE